LLSQLNIVAKIMVDKYKVLILRQNSVMIMKTLLKFSLMLLIALACEVEINAQIPPIPPIRRVRVGIATMILETEKTIEVEVESPDVESEVEIVDEQEAVVDQDVATFESNVKLQKVDFEDKKYKIQVREVPVR